MNFRELGSEGPVSALCLGGGGLGGVWGPISDAEAVATIHAAIDAGITLIDVAPSYGTTEEPRKAERMIGKAFNGRLPDGVRIVTKVAVEDDQDPPSVVRASLEASLGAMKLEYVHFLLHHRNLRPARIDWLPSTLALSKYREELRPVLEELRQEGLIGGFGLTATGHPEAIAAAIGDPSPPNVVQTVTNLLDSPGSLWTFDEAERPDFTATRRLAAANGIGVMGIRTVQGGALADTDEASLADPAEKRDFRRAGGYRELARRRGENPAVLALRYALSLDCVDTVVLGVKSRAELAECVAAEAAGPLVEAEIAEIRQSVRR